MPQLRLLLLGAPGVELGGRPIGMDTHKATALLAYLAVTGQAHSREALAALFWPDYDQHRAYANLRRTLWTINKALGATWLETDADTVGLACVPTADAAGTGLWVDVVEFRARLAEGGAAGGKAAPRHGHAAAASCPACLGALTAAASLYRDDFLRGFNLRDSSDFDEWQFFQSETLRRELAGALERLAAGHAAAGDREPAIDCARRWLALDPLHEPAHRALMRIYAAAGQRNAALRQYAECTRILQAEVGAAPEAETTALYERIKAAAPGAAPASPQSASAGTPRVSAEPASSQSAIAGAPGAPAARTGLPVAPTPFVGRQRELAEIAAALADPACRLLTLVGPGGIGKTRLAIHAAGSQAGAFAGGASFVPLAAVGSANLAAQACAAALGLSLREDAVGDEPGRSVRTQLLDYLAGRELLLVFDNFEHLLPHDGGRADAVDLVTDIVDRAPGVKCLVTSRERLNARGEWTLPVLGMAYPGSPDAPADRTNAAPAAPASFSAVELFLQGARRARVGFVPTEEDLAAIARLCRAVDGTPLAIELAAAWARLLSCTEIAAEIEAGLDFLTASERGIPERHRSLRAVFEHSWQLLGADERRVFPRLAVFQHGFTREAAGQVAGASLAVLSALADKSLLHRSPGGDPGAAPARYFLHEVLRQYAAEKLAEEPAAQDDARARHAGAYGDLLVRLYDELRSPGQAAALALLDSEAANVRLAFNWLVSNAPGRLRRCVIVLLLYYHYRGRYGEGEEALRPALVRLQALQAAHAADDEVKAALALVMAASGGFILTLGRRAEAEPMLAEAVAIAGALPPGIDKALAWVILDFGAGMVSPAEAEDRYRQCLAIFQGLGDAWGIALANLSWANISRSLDPDERLALWRGSLAAFESLGDRLNMAECSLSLSYLAESSGELVEARRLALRSLEAYRELGGGRIQSIRLQLGSIAIGMGDYDEARRCHEEGLAAAIEMGQRWLIGPFLDCLGYVALRQGQLDLAEEHLRRGLAQRRQLDDHAGAAMTLNNLAEVSQTRGDYAEAGRLYDEAAASAERSGVEEVVSHTHYKQAELYLEMGDLSGAEDHLRKALQADVRRKFPMGIMAGLAGWAGLLAARGRAAEAAEVLGMIECQGTANSPVLEEVKQRLAGLAGQLSAAELAAARRRGETLAPIAWLRSHGVVTAD